MYQNGTQTCEGCLWVDQCGQDSRCEDYSTADDGDAFTYYETVLAENAAEYAELVAEMEV